MDICVHDRYNSVSARAALRDAKEVDLTSTLQTSESIDDLFGRRHACRNPRRLPLLWVWPLCRCVTFKSEVVPSSRQLLLRRKMVGAAANQQFFASMIASAFAK